MSAGTKAPGSFLLDHTSRLSSQDCVSFEVL